MLALVLALASCLGYGISDFLGGLKSRSMATLTVLLVSQVSALVLLAAAVTALGEGLPGGTFLLFAALAGVSETLGVAALYRGLAVGTMSIVAPIASTAPIAAVVTGIALGELPTPVQLGGIVLALAGVVLASRTRSATAATAARVTTLSSMFGLLAAAGFGGFYIAMDAASETDVTWALLIARLTAVAILATAALLTRSPPTPRPTDLPVLALIGTIIVAADAMYALATTQGLLGAVAVLSSLHPLVTIGLARLHLHEHLEPSQHIGIACCLVGVAAVSVA